MPADAHHASQSQIHRQNRHETLTNGVLTAILALNRTRGAALMPVVRVQVSTMVQFDSHTTLWDFFTRGALPGQGSVGPSAVGRTWNGALACTRTVAPKVLVSVILSVLLSVLLSLSLSIYLSLFLSLCLSLSVSPCLSLSVSLSLVFCSSPFPERRMFSSPHSHPASMRVGDGDIYIPADVALSQPYRQLGPVRVRDSRHKVAVLAWEPGLHTHSHTHTHTHNKTHTVLRGGGG